jgi:hypothetical protein
VRQLLADLQRPLRVDRAFQAARKQGWAALRAHKIVLGRELARYGLYLRGWEVRGWRNTTFFEKWPLPPEEDEPEIPPPAAIAITRASELPIRKNGPHVDQRPGPADPSLPANRRNRISLTNGPVGRERSLLWPTGQNHPWQNHATGGASFCPPMILPPHDSAGLGSSASSARPWSMAHFALMASVSFASLWACDRGPYGNATGPRRRDRHTGRGVHTDRRFRRNGRNVDQHPRPADLPGRANWRNRILLTNRPAGRARSPPEPGAYTRSPGCASATLGCVVLRLRRGLGSAKSFLRNTPPCIFCQVMLCDAPADASVKPPHPLAHSRGDSAGAARCRNP